MKLWVVRHCSTENSEKKIFSGRTDVPLSARGIAEAARLAEALGGTAFGLVLSSPLLRARATAEAIAQALGQALEDQCRLVSVSHRDMET